MRSRLGCLLLRRRASAWAAGCRDPQAPRLPACDATNGSVLGDCGGIAGARWYTSPSKPRTAALAQPATSAVPHPTVVDEYGATSVVTDEKPAGQPARFENVDGKRIEDGRYAAFTQEISGERLERPRAWARGESCASPQATRHAACHDLLHGARFLVGLWCTPVS